MDPLTRLAQRAQAGDNQAFESLVEATYEPVWRLCASLVSREAADDLAQETFLRVVRALSGFGRRSSARTWILAIARHVCLDERRNRDRRRRRDTRVAVAAVEHPGADTGEEVAVNDLLGQLEPERRAALVLTQLLGLSYAEAAEVCECPVGTIRSRVARARVDLVAALRGTGDAEVGRPSA